MKQTKIEQQKKDRDLRMEKRIKYQEQTQKEQLVMKQNKEKIQEKILQNKAKVAKKQESQKKVQLPEVQSVASIPDFIDLIQPEKTEKKEISIIPKKKTKKRKKLIKPYSQKYWEQQSKIEQKLSQQQTPMLRKRTFYQSRLGSNERPVLKPIRKKCKRKPIDYKKLMFRIKQLLQKGAMSERQINEFLDKQENKYQRLISWCNDERPLIQKKEKRAKNTCKKCYLVGHRGNQCTENITEISVEVLNQRKQQYNERKTKAKKNYNKKYKPVRTFNRKFKQKTKNKIKIDISQK